MLRRLFHLLTAVSLLLCVAAAALWRRSHAVRDDFWYSGSPHWAVGLDAKDGSFVFYQITSGPYSLAPGFSRTDRTKDGWPPFDPVMLRTNGYARRAYDWGGFGFVNATGAARGFRQRFLTVPAWFACAATAVLPAWAALRWSGLRRRLRRSRGLCPTCGYDLRMTPDRCPECGAEKAAASA